jgi:hypothetical protein
MLDDLKELKMVGSKVMMKSTTVLIKVSHYLMTIRMSFMSIKKKVKDTKVSRYLTRWDSQN